MSEINLEIESDGTLELSTPVINQIIEAISPDVTLSRITGGATITIVDKDGTHTVNVYDGEDGTDGTDGNDGVSPTVSTEAITGGTAVTITDADGDHTFNVYNGTNGTNGTNGYSPTATVSKSGSTVTISITDKNGTTTATVSDGDPSDLIDDTAGDGDTGVTWSADKLVDELAEKIDKDLVAGDYSTERSYTKHDLCVHSDTLWMCTTATSGEWDETKWFPISSVSNKIKLLGDVSDTLTYNLYTQGLAMAEAFSSSKTYAVGDYVTRNNNLYICSTAITTAGTWDETKWTQIAVSDELSRLNSAITLTQGMIADAELSSTATSAHAKNTVFRLNNKLLMALSAIAVGDTITTTGGTPNAVEVTLAESFPHDVQIDGTSILTDGVANIPYCSTTTPGLAKFSSTSGFIVGANGGVFLDPATSTEAKAGTSTYNGVVPASQHASVFYGLSKAAGVDLKNETVTLGTYPTGSKTAIKSMLGVVDPTVTDVQVNGTSVLSSGVANVPIASSSAFGTVKVTDGSGTGITFNSENQLRVYEAYLSQIKAGSDSTRPIVPERQHQAVFYGLAKASGDTTQSSSSNAVGTYTADALVKIQKMLGIYEAPWELIREDEFTNATEADYTINVDDNGNAFELTDVRGLFWFPTQNNEAKIANGIVYFYNNSTIVTAVAVDTKTVAANSTKCGAYIMVEQKDGMIHPHGTSWHNSGVLSYDRFTMRLDSTDSTYPFKLAQETAITSIMLKKVTGTMNYSIYGKRKWRT